MPSHKLIIVALIFGFFFAFSPLAAQADNGDWLYELEYTADGLTFPAAAEGVEINGETIELTVTGGKKVVVIEPGLKLIKANGRTALYHIKDAAGATPNHLRRIPLWLSILPPLIAIGLALIFKEVLISLFAGVWVGAFLAGGLRFEGFLGIIKSLLATADHYILDALNDGGHLSVILFSLLIGGMVAIISRNGGMAGVVQRMTKYATTPKSAQVITWVLGVAIFFDDYANTLIVGNTMRSVTDRFKISREKLAYIVDSTAAPVASIAFITTWIGAELGYIGDASEGTAALADLTPYAIFLESLKYSFYPILTLAFILMLVLMQRDYGPMLKAEKRARETGLVKAADEGADEVGETEDLTPVKGAPLRARNAVIPVVTVIIMTIVGLLDTGLASVYDGLANPPGSDGWGATWAAMDGGFFTKLGEVIGSADSYVALLWASISGVVMAVILSVSQGIMNMEQTMGSLTSGFKAMFSAIMILTLAWALAITTEELHTATFLVDLLGDSLNPYFLPPIIFILSALISFSTGSSWSTMAILYPIAIPLTAAVAAGAGWDLDATQGLLYNVISIVLAASVLGDHCSPISDTTILSSLASDCNHIDHVSTQLPYALTVGVVALVLGFLASVLGGGWVLCMLLMLVGMAVLYGVVRWRGQVVL
ncbi:Na+/H+ antiporter NhaC family protein [Neolewinella agarilytica]|uniref:Transporter, NhaC family n=1 Tax=Neolewinella agarilytica TaxID=478744 RepID=A0A1H9DV98_9BACT|nr:Na+/H+ antiporter NhaC family protein [Neolewinella agarilytica]SEQ17322.1 transporter, NhaC family [Neolewinella agarilytica]